MGWFGKLIGSPDRTLLATGIPGRGEITGVSPSGSSMQLGNGLVERNCTFTVNVWIDGVPMYSATVAQRIPELALPQLSTGRAVVAVRVDPKNTSNVAIEFGAEVPEVVLAATSGPGTAAWVLEHGTPIKVVVVQSQNARMKHANGTDVYALTLTVYEGVPVPYQLVVGNGIPPESLQYLFPGSRLHAKLGTEPDAVVIDWVAGPVVAG